MSATATEISKALSLSKPRISQLTSDGTLDGCFVGTGRGRRYDLQKVAERLDHKLDPGQSLGHGAARKKATRDLRQDDSPRDNGETDQPPSQTDDRYQNARITALEERNREQQRKNALADGTYVLASEVAREVQTQMAAEIAAIDSMLGDAARAVADEFQINAGEVRKVLRDTWRLHRQRRERIKGEQSDAAQLTEDEQEANI